MLAGLRRVPMQQEMGEQRFSPSGIERREWFLSQTQVESAQEPDAERQSPHDEASGYLIPKRPIAGIVP
jgi:hypothetical protein